MRRRALLKGAAALAAAAGGLRFLGEPRREGPLFVRRAGDGGTSLLCLHGLFASSAFWLRIADDLAGGFRLVMPDLVGFGHSPQPDADYSVEFHLRWLEPVLAEAPRWTVMGHSMGCVLAAELGRTRPDIVDGVVLFNAPVYASAESRARIFGRHNLLTRLSTRSPTAAWLVCEATVCTPRVLLTRIGPSFRPDVPPQSASDYFRHTYRSYSSSLQHLVMERDLLESLGSVSKPTLVVQGASDDIVERPDRLPWPANVRLQVIPGMDHTSLLLHESARAASIVRSFLDAAPAPPADAASPQG